MALVPFKRREEWDPFNQLEQIHEEMDRLFGVSLSERGTNRLSRFWGPVVEVEDKKDKLVVKAEIPGMNSEDLDVSVQGDMLVIKGEKKQERETKEEDIVRSERFYGRFERDIPLPSSVNADKINATYKNGVLMLNMEKKEEPKGKKLKIDVK